MSATVTARPAAVRTAPRALPGRWREVGGLDALVLLDAAPRTAGMVLAAKASDDWQRRPELRFAVWPDDLEPMT